MSLRRKHQVIVEVTYNSKVTEYNAVNNLRLILDEIDIAKKPVAGNVYIDKLYAKSLTRVITAERIKNQ